MPINIGIPYEQSESGHRDDVVIRSPLPTMNYGLRRFARNDGLFPPFLPVPFGDIKRHFRNLDGVFTEQN